MSGEDTLVENAHTGTVYTSFYIVGLNYKLTHVHGIQFRYQNYDGDIHYIGCDGTFIFL